MTIDDVKEVDIEQGVRMVLARYGRLVVDVGSLAGDTDLFDMGLSSHANVTVMLGLEERFDIEFPEEMLVRATFASVRSISSAVATLVNAAR